MAEAFPISGSIDPKTFPFLLVDLHRRAATGSFKVEGPSYQKALYFRGGRILFGSSNDPRDQLGSILIEDGKITPEQLEDVNSQVGPGKPLAKVLAETGVVSQRELSEAARAKVERILSDVIAYTSGSFEFEDGVLPKGAVDLKLSTERSVLGAVRRIADRNFVLRHLGGLDVVLKLAEGSAERLTEMHGDTGGLQEHLDGIATLKEAASRTQLDEFETAKVACALLFLGIVERATPVGAAAVEVPIFTPADTGEELDLGGGPELSLSVGAPTVASAAVPQVQPAIPSPPAAGAEPIILGDAAPAVTLTPEPTIAAPEVQPPAPRPSIPAIPAAPEKPREVPKPAPPAPRAERPAFSPPPGERARPARATPPRPASKEDLAAVDILLNPRSAEGPLEPLDKGSALSESWGASTERSRLGAPPRRRRGPKTVLIALAVLLGIGLPSAIYYVNSPLKPVRSEPGGQVAAAGPAGSRKAPTAAAPRASARPSVASAMAPSAAPSAAASAPAASPVAPSAAPPATTLSKTAAAPAAAKTSSPTPAPASPKAAPPAPPDPRTLMAQGKFAEAARGFEGQVKAAARGSATIQLLVACSPETVQKAVDNVKAPELLVLPVDLKGRGCYRLCWGLFDSESRAAAATRSVPAYFREGGATPRVVSTASIVP